MWREETDPQTGNKYYYNTSTFETSWERPAEDTPSDPGLVVSQPSLASKPHDQDDEVSTPAVLALEPHGQSDGDTPVAVADWVGLASTLMRAKRAWRALVDNNTGHTFYYDEATGVSQWEAPPEMTSDEHQEPEPAVNGPHGEARQDAVDLQQDLEPAVHGLQGARQDPNDQQQGPEPVHGLQVARQDADDQQQDADPAHRQQRVRQGAHDNGVSDRPQREDSSISSTTTASNVVDPAGAPAALERRTSPVEEDKVPGVVAVAPDLDSSQASPSPLDLDPAAHGEVIRERRTELEAGVTEDRGRGEKGEETNSESVTHVGDDTAIRTETAPGGDGRGEEGVGRNYEHGASKDDAQTEGVAFDGGTSIELEAPAAPADRTSSSRTPPAQDSDGGKIEGGDSFERIERVESSSTLSTHGEGLDSLAQYVTGHSSTPLDRGAAAAEIEQSSNQRGRETAQTATNGSTQLPTDDLPAQENVPTLPLLHTPISDGAEHTQKGDVDDVLPGSTNPSGHVVSFFDTAAFTTVAFDRLQAGLILRRQAAASVRIQAQARRWAAVRLHSRLSERRDVRRREELEARQRAATAIQAVIRGFAGRKEVKVKVRIERGSENERTRDEPMARATENSVHAYPDKDESTDRGTDDGLNKSDTSIVRSSSSNVQQQYHTDDTSSVTHASRAGSTASADTNLGRREEESLATEGRGEGANHGVHEKNVESAWLGAENDRRGFQRTPEEQDIIGNQQNQPSSTTSDGFGGTEVDSPLPGQVEAADEEDLQQDDRRREGTHAEPSSCPPGLDQEPDSLGGSRLDGGEVGKTSPVARVGETSDGSDVVYEEPASVGDGGNDSDETSATNSCKKGSKASTGGRGGGWSERTASTRASGSDSGDCSSSHQSSDSDGNQPNASSPHNEATEINITSDAVTTVDRVGGVGQGTAPLKRAAESAGAGDHGGDSDETSSCSTGTTRSGNSTSTGGGGGGGRSWSERTASNSSSTSENDGDFRSHRNYGSEGLQQSPPAEATADNNVFDPAAASAAAAAADHAGRVEQEPVFLGGTEHETRYARDINALEKVVGETVEGEGAHIDATAPLERLEDLRSLVTEQAEATAKIAMAATWTKASRREAGRMRYAHPRPS